MNDEKLVLSFFFLTLYNLKLFMTKIYTEYNVYRIEINVYLWITYMQLKATSIILYNIVLSLVITTTVT